MLAELAVVVIMLFTVALVYLKGTTIKAFLLLISTFAASTIAFSYFETAGSRLIISHGFMPRWAIGLSLLLIFALCMVILNTIGNKLLTADIYFGDAPDKIAKCSLAAFAGFAIAGVILTAISMMPVGTKLPYARYSTTLDQPVFGQPPEPQKKLILNADGFIINVVSWISGGSMSGQKSFAAFHPSLLNEIYLNRIACDEQIAPIAEASVSVESAIAPQTQLVAKSDNKPVSGGPQTKAVIIKTKTDRGIYTMSQFRLICKDSGSADNFHGSRQVFWPTGYTTSDTVVEVKKLTDTGSKQSIDLVFYIPTDTVPVLLQYKLNAIAEVGKLKIPQPPAPQTPAKQTPAEQNSVK